MLTRLEEFQTFTEMVSKRVDRTVLVKLNGVFVQVKALRAESTIMHYDSIKKMESKVANFTESVNKLEKLVNKVGEDVELVDQLLTEAEACMPVNKDGPLNTILSKFVSNRFCNYRVVQVVTMVSILLEKTRRPFVRQTIAGL